MWTYFKTIKKYSRKLVYYFQPFCFDFSIDKDLHSLVKKINMYFLLFPQKKKKYKREIAFINNNLKVTDPLQTVFPYCFTKNYSNKCFDIFFDDLKKLYYVIYKGKKLYYSRKFNSSENVRRSFISILAEQDDNSPHRYFDLSFNVNAEDTVIDIGSAEGNFSLEIIDKVQELFIFETDPDWLEALYATFEPWKEKVTIINKYIGNIDNNHCITLDSLFAQKNISFIKIDVEGAEISVLKGAINTIKYNMYLKIAVATYHRKHDARKIKRILLESGFSCKYTKGYMLFIYNKLQAPFFRKGLILANKPAI